MKNLIIIGASGFGREVYNLATLCKGYNNYWRIKGFLDDNPNILDNYPNYPSIIGGIEDYCIRKNDVFICALGSIKLKRRMVSQIKSRGGIFINLVHHSNIIYQNVKIGDGAILGLNSSISSEVTIGDYVSVLSNVVIGHDAVIGSYVHIGASVFLGGSSIVEDEVTLHPGCIILPNIKIGKGSIIGAGSVVIQNVKPETTVFGNPATRL